jgi:hypothetical protein
LGWAHAATVVKIDAAGLDLHVQGDGQTAIVRVPFAPPLTDPAQLRPTLVALAEQARIGISDPEIVYAPTPERDPLSAQRLFNVIATRRSFGPAHSALLRRATAAARLAGARPATHQHHDARGSGVGLAWHARLATGNTEASPISILARSSMLLLCGGLLGVCIASFVRARRIRAGG